MTEVEKLNFLTTAIKFLFNKDVSELTPELNLMDVGLDSLDIVELQLYYEEVTGDETEDQQSPLITVADLIRMMK